MSDKKEEKDTLEQVITSSTTKKPRYTTSSRSPILHQWTQQPQQQQSPLGPGPGPGPQQSPTSPDTSSSPSAQEFSKQQLRKGKFVSPVWKPHEMLWLAKAWRAQYQDSTTSASSVSLSGDGSGSGGGGGGRGKTRAEKDKEVAEFLMKEGVNRDAKTAGTKWDNMLGEFRKVYEWERGGEKESNSNNSNINIGGGGGKSYFRLSPYERKLHRLPASFDEQVFEELTQFMGPRMRPTSTTTSNIFYQHGVGDFGFKALPPPPPPPPSLPGMSSYRDDEFPMSSMLAARTRQMEQYTTMRSNPRHPMLVGYDPYPHPHPHHHPLLDFGTRAEMRRIGRLRMTWDESVSLWAEEGEYHRGRIKVHGTSLFNADEIVYFDDSMVASTLEAFEDGPFKGFSVDSFVPGSQLKVFGRRSRSNQTSGINERFAIPIGDPSTRWEFQDPTDYHLGCLRMLPGTLPTLMELSWYIQEPPPEEFRMPLRRDIYRDLPQGKELFFTTSSSDPLDCKSFTIDVLSSIIRSNPSISGSTSTSRDSYIGLWDDCINRVISKFCPIEMVFIRKQNKVKSKSELLHDTWPNLTGMVKKLCLWRGEEVDRIREMSSQSETDDPSSTITTKMVWTYNNELPYVLGYYSIGHNVTFCALSPSQKQSTSSTSSSSHKPEITRTDLYSLDLSNPSERLKSIIPCWRIGILLASLAEKCSKNCESDFNRQTLGDGTIIEMTPNTMTKFYPSKKNWQKIKEIYDMLDQRIPHAEHLISHNEIELSLGFKPRGIKTKPKNCEQLILALKQVTKALVALHDLSFMHRDLSWDKVMLKSGSEKEWFVSGFEEAVGAPQINPRVAVEGHAPEMARGVHGVKVDVWGVGYLVKTSGVKVTKGEESVVGIKIRELEEKCMEVNPENRPTAADCYHHLLQIQSSLFS
ncbi:uncharacterized protein LOC141609440 [Silene latifolia]|uniref:uncharacterized protein LOC141609440 n=1 Tax=Silene latifolia TaxID=37657 RepID=UPI003D76C71A